MEDNFDDLPTRHADDPGAADVVVVELASRARVGHVALCPSQMATTLFVLRLAAITGVGGGTLAGEAIDTLRACPAVQARVTCALVDVHFAVTSCISRLAEARVGVAELVACTTIHARLVGAPVGGWLELARTGTGAALATRRAGCAAVRTNARPLVAGRTHALVERGRHVWVVVTGGQWVAR